MGPISDVKMSDIKPFTVFIGRSATGKSTIMKVTALFRYLFKLASIRSYLHHSEIKRSPFRLDFSKLLKENGLYGMVENSTEIVYTVLFDDNTDYTIEFRNRKLSALPSIEKPHLTFVKGAFISENRNALSSWIGTGLQRISVNLGYYFKETLDLFMSASDSLKEIELPFIDARFAVKKAGNGIKSYELTRANKPFKLKDASSGMKSTVPIAVIARYLAEEFSFEDAFNRSVLDYVVRYNRLNDFRPFGGIENFEKIIAFHVEEPELSLDPYSQALLIEFLCQTLYHKVEQDRSCRTLMATHSPYIVNYLNLMMAKYEKNASEGINPEYVDVYLTNEDGTITSVLVRDESDRKVIDTSFLSDIIQDFYTDYSDLRL